MFVSMAAMDFLFPWIHVLNAYFFAILSLERASKGLNGLRLGSDNEDAIGCDAPVEFCASLQPHSFTYFLRYGGLAFACEG